jgi:anti-anti-sigma factor
VPRLQTKDEDTYHELRKHGQSKKKPARIVYPIEMIGDLPVVTAPAEITASDADQLRISLLMAASCRSATIVLDMAKTRRCESAALRVLERAHLRAQSGHGELRLAASGADVLDELARAGLDWLIPRYASLADAVGPVGQHGPFPSGRA